MSEIYRFVGVNDEGAFWNEADQCWGSLQDATRYTLPDHVPEGTPIGVWDAVTLVLGRIVRSLYEKGLFSAEYGAYVTNVTGVPLEDIALVVQLFDEVERCLQEDSRERSDDANGDQSR